MVQTRGMRVRKSGRIANRTVVAQDERGRIVVCVSEGAYTLSDFATLLMAGPLKLTHAMSMDGGLESELVVQSPGVRYASFGDWPPDRDASAPGKGSFIRSYPRTAGSSLNSSATLRQASA